MLSMMLKVQLRAMLMLTISEPIIMELRNTKVGRASWLGFQIIKGLMMIKATLNKAFPLSHTEWDVLEKTTILSIGNSSKQIVTDDVVLR